MKLREAVAVEWFSIDSPAPLRSPSSLNPAGGGTGAVEGSAGEAAETCSSTINIESNLIEKRLGESPSFQRIRMNRRG